MKFLLWFIVLVAINEVTTKKAPIKALNDVDACIKAIRKNIKGKNTTKTLTGLVGMGWDDLTNSYTLPILKTSFKKCLTDNNNEYIIPDNVFIIQLQDAKVERTAETIDSFKSMMDKSTTKVGVAASATVKGVQVGGSFGSENMQSKESFEKQSSIMFLNKIYYASFELIVDENDGFDQYFMERLEDIAQAVDERKMLWGKFLAETFISDFGTHLIYKSKAGAEIIQETYIEKSETYKSEKTVEAYKAEISLGFKEIAKISIGYETRNEKSETHTTSSVTTSKILKTHGGPDIRRISKEDDTSMLHVENLVGLEKDGKYLYEIISAVKLAKFSDRVKYTVQSLIRNATEDYYRYNYRPGCMDIDSENFNRIANVEDDSCMNPNLLFAFTGIFQTCTPVSASPAIDDDIFFGMHCENLNKRNPYTDKFGCANDTQAIKVYSLTKYYNDRKTKIKQEKCGFFSFIFGCKIEVVKISIIDEIRLDVYWCPIAKNLTKFEQKKREPNQLDKIMVAKSLQSISDQPNLLTSYFPDIIDEWLSINKSKICDEYIQGMFDQKDPEGEYRKVQLVVDYYDSMARGFSRLDNLTGYGSRKYDIMWDESPIGRTDHRYSYYASNSEKPLLEIKEDQLQLLKHFPKALQHLLPILKIPKNIRYSRSMHEIIANNPEILEKILFNSTTIYEKEPPQQMLFGGAFKTGTLNPFTGTYNCPANFIEFTIIFDLNLCLSNDNTLKWPLRLGGFFNCHSNIQVCPIGYSAYMGTIHDGCEHYYCIRYHSRDYVAPPIINKPPYTDYRKANEEAIPSY